MNSKRMTKTIAIVAGMAVAAVVLYAVGTSVVQIIVRMHGG
jgi:hypothetical protein